MDLSILCKHYFILPTGLNQLLKYKIIFSNIMLIWKNITKQPFSIYIELRYHNIQLIWICVEWCILISLKGYKILIIMYLHTFAKLFIENCFFLKLMNVILIRLLWCEVRGVWVQTGWLWVRLSGKKLYVIFLLLIRKKKAWLDYKASGEYKSMRNKKERA